MCPALLARSLDDLALIVRGIQIEIIAHGIQGNHRKLRTVTRKPCVLASARQAGHWGNRPAVIFMGRVVQTGELVAVEKKAGLVIGETVGPVIATVLLRQRFPEWIFSSGRVISSALRPLVSPTAKR